MLDILFLSVMFISLGVVLFIVVRKFPQMANLDIDNLPEEKIYQKKKQIINKRIDESSNALKKKVVAFLVPLRKKIWGQIQLQFRIYVGKIERLLHHEEVLKIKLENQEASPQDREQKLAQLIADGEQYLKLEEYDQAEERFIAAIKNDAKSVSAYKGLADTYLAKNAIEEAKQTYQFLLKINPNDDTVFVKLAEIAEEQNNLEEAIQCYQQAVLLNDSFSPRFYHLAELLSKVDQPQVAKESILQAVELEPQNPKYLDFLIEIAIICDDKALATKAYNDLRLVNADNQKLPAFKDRIKHM